MNQKENKQELKRQLSPMHVWALAFGCVVGWELFSICDRFVIFRKNSIAIFLHWYYDMFMSDTKCLRMERRHFVYLF